MKMMLAIALRDLKAAFYSPLAYALLSIFLFVAGFFFFNLLGSFNFAVAQEAQLPVGELPRTLNLNEWVVQGYFQTLLLLQIFIVPLMTMRVVSDERQGGTYLLLQSLPLSSRELFMGKMLANCLLLVAMLALAFLLPLGLCLFSTPEVLPMLSGMLGLLFAGCAFVAIGTAIACLSKNALLSGVLTLAVFLLLYGAHVPSESFDEFGQNILRYLSPLWQLRDPFRGVITLASLVYFSSLMVVAIAAGSLLIFPISRKS